MMTSGAGGAVLGAAVGRRQGITSSATTGCSSGSSGPTPHSFSARWRHQPLPVVSPAATAATAQASSPAPPQRQRRPAFPGPEVHIRTEAPAGDKEYDAIVVGGGMGGLATAARLVAGGASVLVLEKYLIPGGSAGHFKRDGYTFDVGSSMMFGFGKRGGTNLMTRALASVGKSMATVADPTQVHYHLPKSERHPKGLGIQVWRDFDQFVAELTSRFPHEAAGIRDLYAECWAVFNALNSLELKSLEEPRYLMGEFFKHPIECLTLARYATSNTGDIARKHLTDPELLRFLDLECFIFSTVKADLTPLVNGAMVFCDRHYGGINYPIGGVGQIAVEMATGIEECGGHVVYAANVKHILRQGEGPDARACGVQLADGRTFRAKTVISNATRWDTFDKLLEAPASVISAPVSGTAGAALPQSEVEFRDRFIKAPSFVSLHLGVDAAVLAGEADCHHVILEDWTRMETARGTLFVSMPSILDPTLAPAGRHIVHAFTPDWIANWQGMTDEEYEVSKEAVADELIARLDIVFPGMAKGIHLKEVGTPRSHRRFLGRADGTYGPIPSRRPAGMLTLPLNTTAVPGLYCAGDSTFPGQGVNAVVFSGFGCAHRVLVDLGKEPGWPVADQALRSLLAALRHL